MEGVVLNDVRQLAEAEAGEAKSGPTKTETPEEKLARIRKTGQAAREARRKAKEAGSAPSPANPLAGPAFEDDDPYRDLGAAAPVARLEGASPATAATAAGASTEQTPAAATKASGSDTSPAWPEAAGRESPPMGGASRSGGSS